MYNPNSNIYLSGFTFCKNAIKLSYPIKATIDCLLYYCDEVIINLGVSEDNTVELIQGLYGNSPKVKIFLRNWPGKESGTLFYRNETNFALEQCTGKFALYLQGDECMHEDDKPILYKELKSIEDNPDVLALSNRFIHFEGDFNSLKGGYQFECRVLRNIGVIKSWGDAQGFKLKNTEDIQLWKYQKNNQPIAPVSKTKVFHYGYVRPPKIMFEKAWDMDQYYHIGDDLKTYQDKMNERWADRTWGYTHWGAMEYHGTHPIFAKEYIKQYETSYPKLIRYPAQFNDDDIKPYLTVTYV